MWALRVRSHQRYDVVTALTCNELPSTSTVHVLRVSIGHVHGLSWSDGHFQWRCEAGYRSRRWNRDFDSFTRGITSHILRDVSKEELIVALNGPLQL